MNVEPGTWNLEPGTRNPEPGTWNLEPGTALHYLNSKYPMRFAPDSVNQSRVPRRAGGWRSLPAVRPVAELPSPSGNSVMTPSGVTRPRTVPLVNHTLRSGPTAMLIGEPVWLGIGNSVTTPSIVMRPTRLPSGVRLSM